MAEKANRASEVKTGSKDQNVTIGEYKDKVCVACLGILQDNICSPAFIDQVRFMFEAEVIPLLLAHLSESKQGLMSWVFLSVVS